MWLELVGAAAQWIIVDAYGCRPDLTVIPGCREEDIGISAALIGPCNIELASLWVAGKGWEREVAIAFRREETFDVVNCRYQHWGGPGVSTIGRGGYEETRGNGAAHQVYIGEGYSERATGFDHGNGTLGRVASG